MKRFLILLLLPLSFPASASAVSNGPGCGFRDRIPQELVKESREWRSDTGILKPRRLTPRSAPHMAMERDTVRRMLVASWRSFGFSRAASSRNAIKNLRQVKMESSFLPYILQRPDLKDANRKNPAGGLFQFIPETFEAWQVHKRFGDRFNPLANILAAVNAQVNSGMRKPLAGRGGWGPGFALNPCA